MAAVACSLCIGGETINGSLWIGSPEGRLLGHGRLNPIECGPLPANVSFLSVLDDKTSQMLFVLWRQVALVKGHFFERTASCVKKRLSSPLLKCIPQTGFGCVLVRAPSATSIRSTRIGLEFLMYHAGIQARSPTTSIWGASPR